MRSGIEPEYGIVGAGAVSTSLAGQFPRNARALGPVAGVSYRVASRIANTLKSGWPVRSFDELDQVRLILFYSPPEYFAVLAETLATANIQWVGKSLLFCDCEAGGSTISHFRQAGASVARLRRCGVPGRLVVEGEAPATTWANRLVRELKVKPVMIDEGCEYMFDAAMTLGSAAITPLLDGIAQVLRQCGVRDSDSVQLAAAMLSRTTSEYAHSGRQSWVWHIQEPDAAELLDQIASIDGPLQLLLRELLLLGFKTFDRHRMVADIVRRWGDQASSDPAVKEKGAERPQVRGATRTFDSEE